MRNEACIAWCWASRIKKTSWRFYGDSFWKDGRYRTTWCQFPRHFLPERGRSNLTQGRQDEWPRKTLLLKAHPHPPRALG
jgi:hypothetical protein